MITYEITTKGRLLTRFETKWWRETLSETERLIMLSLYMGSRPRTSQDIADDIKIPVIEVEMSLRRLDDWGYTVIHFGDNPKEVGMEPLTLITDEREYVPETTKPGMPQTEEAWKKVEEERIAWEKAEKIAEKEASGMSNPEEFIKYFTTRGEAESELGPIDWYIGDKPPYKYGPEDECFYCVAPAIMFKVTKLTDGKLIGYPVCRTHAGGDVMFEHSSNPGEPIGSNFHSLMLHAVAEMYGPGGIVVDEVKAKATSCECVEYKPGKFWCTSKGVVGALTDEQEKIYCNPRVMFERPGMKERMAQWAESVEICRAQLPPTDGQTRLEIYLDCMSRELTKAGVEA